MKRHKTTIIVIVLLIVTLAVGIGIINAINSKTTQRQLEADRQYKAEQKAFCMGIYKQESTKWNNVESWNYDEIRDKCFVVYRENPRSTEAQCRDKFQNEEGKIMIGFMKDYLLCLDGYFENDF